MLLKVMAMVLLLAEDNGEAAPGSFDWIPGISADHSEDTGTPPSSETSFFNIFGSDENSSKNDPSPGFFRSLEDSAVSLFQEVFMGENSKDESALVKEGVSNLDSNKFVVTFTKSSGVPAKYKREEESSFGPTTHPPMTASSEDTSKDTPKPSEPPAVDEVTVNSVTNTTSSANPVQL